MDKKPGNTTIDRARLFVNIHFEENRKRQGLTFDTTTTAADPNQEQQVVVDKSRKGAVDSRISTLVQLLNSPKGDFFTTSSCSGRIILFTHDVLPVSSNLDIPHPSGLEPEHDLGEESSSFNANTNDEIPESEQGKTRKKGCKWLHVTHDECQVTDIIQAWKDLPGGTNAVFKMEPSIIHVQCRDLASAKKLVHIATQVGFRNSGMVIGKDNKITAAARSAMGLEVPLKKEQFGEDPSVSLGYMTYFVNIANQKLLENWKRTDQFETELTKALL